MGEAKSALLPAEATQATVGDLQVPIVPWGKDTGVGNNNLIRKRMLETIIDPGSSKSAHGEAGIEEVRQKVQDD
jgi:hypothetical protein